VTRAEDVALGCLASLVAGALFWPRGAGAALGLAFADAYRTGADLLGRSTARLTGAGIAAPDAEQAASAGRRLEDALRQYLAEQGGKRVPLESVSALAAGAARLRFAGTAIVGLDGSGRTRRRDADLEPVIGVLERRAEQVRSWYEQLAAALDRRPGPLPAAADGGGAEPFLEVVLPAIERCGDGDRATYAETLLWSAQYVGDVDRQRRDLLEPASQVAAARARPWWSR
jgi:hypothetical protein